MRLVDWPHPNEPERNPVNNANSVVWTIVGILAVIALLFYVIPKIH